MGLVHLHYHPLCDFLHSWEFAQSLVLLLKLRDVPIVALEGAGFSSKHRSAMKPLLIENCFFPWPELVYRCADSPGWHEQRDKQ